MNLFSKAKGSLHTADTLQEDKQVTGICGSSLD